MPDVVEVVFDAPHVVEVGSGPGSVKEVVSAGPAGAEGPPGPPGGVTEAQVEALITQETEGDFPSPALVFANALI